MILVQEQKLHFLDDKSDKVYEVELYHLQLNEYVVNFRFGRRGSALRDGTKTVFPVGREQASKIFDDLVDSKIKKGYQPVTVYSNETPMSEPVKAPSNRAQVNTIREYLDEIAEGRSINSNWELSRIIWRAAELHIEEAIPAIRKLMPQLTGQERYAAIYFLGKIANAACHDVLKDISVTDRDLWSNIYLAAMVRCENEETINQVVDRLPVSLKTAFMADDVDSLFQQIDQWLFNLQTAQTEFLLHVYILSIQYSKLRRPVQDVLSQIEFKPNYWKTVRYIYKVAEMIEDYSTVGLLAARIQQHRQYYKSYYGSVWLQGQHIKPENELKKQNSRLAFSFKTKNYFTRRAIRALRRLGQDGQEAYCQLASAILLRYNEGDRKNHPDVYSGYYDQDLRRYISHKRVYPSLAHIPFLFHIGYATGDRLKIKGLSNFYYENEIKLKQNREDAFPNLWDMYPKYAVQLVTEGQLIEVVDIGMHMIRNRRDLAEMLSFEQLAQMMTQSFEEVTELASQVARDKYNAQEPNFDFINHLIRIDSESAIDLAMDLIAFNHQPFTTHIACIKSCLMSTDERVHAWMRTHVSEDKLDAADVQSIIDGTLTFYKNQSSDRVLASSIDTFLHCFGNELAKMDLNTCLALMDENNPQLHLLVGKLILNSDTPIEQIPNDLIISMIGSEHEEIRAQGIGLLGKFNDDVLLSKFDLIASLALSDQADLRDQASDLIGRLAPNDEFNHAIFLRLYPELLKNHDDEDFRPDIFDMIEQHLTKSIPLIYPNIETVLKDDHREAHLLVDYLLEHFADLNQWPIDLIALMGNHDMKKIRQQAYAYYSNHVDRMKFDRENALRLLDSDWDETRAFAADYFDTHFSADEWNAELIISLCDNVRPEVQSYGTRILTRYFREEQGVKYLTQLSEHPDQSIQLYTTNYLDRFAFNDINILNQLRPYFKTILTSINKNSAAKQRVFHFLSKQADEGAIYGEYVAQLINDVVQTIAIMDKETCILILHKINKRYPEVNTKVERVEHEIRNTTTI